MTPAIGIIIAILATVWLSIGLCALWDWIKRHRHPKSPPVFETIRMAFEPCYKGLLESWKTPAFGTLWTAAWTGTVALIGLLIFWPLALIWLLPSRSMEVHGGPAGK